MPKGAFLTHQQLIFLREYLVDFDMKRAIKTAGYKDDKPGVLALKSIQNALLSATTELSEGDATAKMVVDELAKIAFSNPKDFVSWDAIGNVTLKPSSQMTDQAAACISAISVNAQGTLSIKFWDKKSALELLCRYFGILNDKVTHGGKVEHEHYDYSGHSKEELRSEANKLVLQLEAIANGNGNGNGSNNGNNGNGSRRSSS